MAKEPISIKSDFAILDVKTGRAALARQFTNRPALGPCPEPMRIPVVIVGYIDGIWGGDDGVSQEFTVHVEGVTTGLPGGDVAKVRK